MINLLLHRIGYSKKGWTSGEIGIEWIKIFDKQTHEKAEGDYRLLLVDGHNSHYTRGFLEHARKNQIVVLCYPAHTTHVYQGLDVVIFAIMKKNMGEAREIFERRTGREMKKKDFLTIYAEAHAKTMTAENIKAAFRKTGTWPVNPNVITPEMMAPSKTTSMEGHLPIVPPTPVRVVSNLLSDLLGILIQEDLESDGDAGLESEDEDEEWEDDNRSHHLRVGNPITMETITEENGDGISDDEEWEGITKAMDELEIASAKETPHSEVDAQHERLKKAKDCIMEAVKRLQGPLLTRLVSSHSQPGPSKSLPPLSSNPSMAIQSGLSVEPKTNNELILLTALRESRAEVEFFQRRNLEVQAATILNEIYCKDLSAKLAFHEQEKGKKRGEGRKKLMGDGLPVLLTGDYFLTSYMST